MVFLILVSVVLVAVVFFVITRFGGGGFPWISFYVRGKESGFSFSEIFFLRRVAVANRVRQPTSLFWSIKTLDRCLRTTVVGFRSSGDTENSRNLEFLNKLFDFRARVEFAQPRYRLGLSSTRGISPGQTMKIAVSGSGVFLSKVVETNRRYMVITYPRGRKPSSGFSWKKQQPKIFFWRQDDAGYFFETRVIDEYSDRKVPVLHIAHVDSLVRTQKRKSVRRAACIPARLLPLRTIVQADESEIRTGGYRCKLLDISEDGAAIAVGGKVRAGLPIKIQARPGDETLILNGIVKHAAFQQKNNVTVLHMEAQRPSDRMRIRILVYVYALFDAASREVTPVNGTFLPDESDTPGDIPKDIPVDTAGIRSDENGRDFAPATNPGEREMLRPAVESIVG